MQLSPLRKITFFPDIRSSLRGIQANNDRSTFNMSSSGNIEAIRGRHAINLRTSLAHPLRNGQNLPRVSSHF